MSNIAIFQSGLEKFKRGKWMGYLKDKKGQSPDEIIEKLRGR